MNGVTFIDLEFDTSTKGGALLGDIGSSLVSLDELLRDLASIAADPSSAEFRQVEIAAIEMRSPLKIRLSLRGISPEAVKAFQELCRDIILRRGDDAGSRRRASLKHALTLCRKDGTHADITEPEAQRLLEHLAILEDAEIPLKRIEVKAD